MRPVEVLRRTTGAAAGSTLVLGLLVCGCVFTAVAGPALSLHTRTEALRQSVAGFPSTTNAVQVTGSWMDFTGALNNGGYSLNPDYIYDQSTAEIGQGLTALGLPLAAGDWVGLSTGLLPVSSGAAAGAQAGAPPKLEVAYRNPLAGHAQLVRGTYASGTAPAGSVAVAATTQTAARFGLRPGSRLVLRTVNGPVRLFVTAIVTERAPAATFWAQDPAVGTPSLQQPTAASPPYWLGGVIADPGQADAMLTAFAGSGLELMWDFPLDVGGVNADAAPGLYAALNRAVTSGPALDDPLATGASALTVASPLAQDLAQFLTTEAAIQTVLLLLFASLAVVGAIVILLAARMIVERRGVELAMLRARGGSQHQVAAVMARTAAIAAVPAAAIGAGLAVALIPGGAQETVSSRTGWMLAAAAGGAALAGAPLVAAWRYRRPTQAANQPRITGTETGQPPRAWRRPVAEAAACAAAVGGLVVLHDQGVPADGGVDWYLTITPVLVAIPVVVIMLRLYPLAIGGLLRLSARGTGATGFVALAGAARSSLTGPLPAAALVLALNVATFAGMIAGGITRGAVTASWATTGADVLIDTGPNSPAVSPAVVRAIAAVPGVRHVAAVWDTTWVMPFGQPVTVVAADPATYAALVADTPFPAVRPAALRAAPGGVLSRGAAVPVLASPAAAAVLGSGTTQLNSLYTVGSLTVRVAGILAATPAQPGGGSFVVMPLERLPGPAGQPAPNRVLVTGSAIDDSRLAAVADAVIPGNLTTIRAAVLASLTSSPLQRGAGLLIALTRVAAIAFGLFIVILGLALGSGERELTLARLTVMGLERSVSLVLAEAMPTVLGAVAAGAACALVLPLVIGSSIDLSAFTGTAAPVQFKPGLAAFGLPAAAILVIVLAALAAQTRALRRRGITGILRAN